MNLEVYTSGYGAIEAPKLVMYPSVTAFDPSRSVYMMGTKVVDDLITFGGQEFPMDSSGTGNTVLLHEDLFVDVPGESQMVLTEKRLGGWAPVHLIFHLLKNARPGSHEIEMRLTYFNGEAWASSYGSATVQVRNVFERSELVVWVLGLIAAVLGILIRAKTVLQWFTC